jgi:hypothetical protein
MDKPEEKRPLGTSRRKRVHNIRMDLVEVRWGDVDRIGLAQESDMWRAVVNSVSNFPVVGGKARRKVTARKIKT